MPLSFDRSLIDRPRLFAWLQSAYWSKDRSIEAMECSLDHSLCLSAWEGDQMAGFARVVTDYATFAWLCDVIVGPEFRGRGAGKAMVAEILGREDLASVRWMLGTCDAHSLYVRYRFTTSTETDRWMTKGFNIRPARDP